MSACVYALLAGIDDYPAPVPPLGGCLNDIAVFETFLKERASGEGFRLDVHALRNSQASRQAIIDGFLNHLSRAGEQDVVLFYYSGHGSQERTPPEFWHLEPDRLDETLVCYDSRLPGNYDLADKELAKLIAHVARNNPHVVVILDSCHSGSGTRAPYTSGACNIRRIPTDLRERPIDSFLVTPDEAGDLAARTAPGRASRWLMLPRGRHILMAACREDEEAKEITSGGLLRGLFSSCLTGTLETTGAPMTYRDVFKRTNALVRSKAARQSPLIEAVDVRDLDRPFLGGAIQTHPPYFTVSFDPANGWVMDAGAVHGIPPVTDQETTMLALLPATAPIGQVESLQQSIGEARVTLRMAARSKVALTLKNGLPDPQLTYKAIITLVTLPPLGVEISSEGPAATLFRQVLETAGPGGSPSLLVHEAVGGPDLRLIVWANGYRIMRAADDRPLAIDIEGISEESARKTVERMEHIARWIRIAELKNPSTSLPRDAVKLELYVLEPSGEETRVDAAAAGAELRFSYEVIGEQRTPPRFKMRLVNQSGRRLYCMLLDLPETYGIFSGLLEGNGVWLDPQAEAWVKVNGDVLIPGTIPDEYLNQGLTELKDTLKLIVSTEECDATLLDQGDLDVRFEPNRGSRGFLAENTLNSLMRRVQTRHFSPPPSTALADWMASELSITIVCPRERVPVPAEAGTVELAPNVTLMGHPSLRAVAHLSTAVAASRNADLPPSPPLPPWLVDDPSVAGPFQFSAGRGGEDGLSVLALDDVDRESAATVTRDAPLRLRVEARLRADEHVLPLAYDGEFFLPLGWAEPLRNALEIRLERLPEPAVNARSLTGSIRIFFKKIVAQRLGTAYEYPLLAMVESGEGGAVHYVFDRDRIRASVKAARRILLYAHGIIGDTQSMAASAFHSGLAVESPIPLMKEGYDLILAFDYENLNTEIEQTARDLKQRLADVSLDEGHGKELHIAAHSMGGLVSRWFIEREGGNRVVRHLIMLGTPNAGSPWPVVEDWVTILLGIGLNGLSRIPWPPTTVGFLMRALTRIGTEVAKRKKSIEVALQEMNPDSEFLKSLAQSHDPGIRYTIIAGNTSLIPAALEAREGKSSCLKRLLQRLRPQRLLHETAALAFFDLPNDIAASVRAIAAVPQSRTPPARIQEVACDHLSYFNSEAGLRELAKLRFL